MLVEDGYNGSHTLPSESFSDKAHDTFITRRGVRVSEEQMVFVRRDLAHRQVSGEENVGRSEMILTFSM